MKHNNKILFFTTFTLFILSIFACSDDPIIELPGPVESISGAYVINEGQFNQNNASISHFDYISSTLTLNLFAAANPGQDVLGDVANDAGIYGSKLYVVVNNSNKVEVLNAANLERLNGGVVDIQMPRNIAFAAGKTFVSSWDNHVYVIDTASFDIVDTIDVGRNAEMMAVVNDKLYVANSGALSASFDNRIFIINPISLEVEGQIEVADNLTRLYAGAGNKLYAQTSDVYDASWTNLLVPSTLYEIDLTTRAISHTFGFSASAAAANSFAAHDGIAYIYSTNYGNEPTLLRMDLSTNTILDDQVLDVSQVETVYGIGVNPNNGDIWIADALDYSVPGRAFVFDINGNAKGTYGVGYIPSKFLFH